MNPINFLNKVYKDFNMPPEATKSISVIPAQINVGELQTPEEASKVFALGLSLQKS